MHTSFVAALALLASVPFAPAALAGDALSAARAAYRDAAYEDALGALDRMGSDPSGAARSPDAQRLRALCLLALDREPEARQSLRALVQDDPRVSFASADTPPRLRTMLEEARRTVVPEVVRQRYRAARSLFETGAILDAAVGFREALGLAATLRDGDVADAGSLARELYEVSLRMAEARLPSASWLPPGVVSPSAAADAAESAWSPVAPADAAGAVVVPPRAIYQPVKPVPRSGDNAPVVPYRGKVLVIINERGEVENARIAERGNPLFDAVLLESVRLWRYEPASRDGVPVPFTSVALVTMDVPR